MTSAQWLLDEMRRRGFVFTLEENGTPSVSPASNLTPADRAGLLKAREEIINLLQWEQEVHVPGFPPDEIMAIDNAEAWLKRRAGQAARREEFES